MNIAFIRGQYLNNFELQSYYPLLGNQEFKLTGFSSQRTIHQIKVPVKQFFSPVDLPDFPYKFPVLNRLFIDAMYLYGLEKALTGFDIAHVRETYFHFSHQAIKAKQNGFKGKVLVTCSETIVHNHETIWGRKNFKQDVIKNADYFHTLTKKAKETLIAEGANPSKIEVIPYGVDLEKFKPMDIKKDKQLTVLFVARLEEQKGVFELLEAWKRINKEHNQIILRVVGSGPLSDLFTQIGIFPEKYPYEKMPEIMNQADFLMLPSKPTHYWEEYFGMVLLEAMACGLPVVTTNCGAIPEVVGNAALIAEHSNTNSLYQKLKEMIVNPQCRTRLREKGMIRVRTQFDSRNQAKKLGELYQHVASLS